jgi:hypothetical protein
MLSEVSVARSPGGMFSEVLRHDHGLSKHVHEDEDTPPEPKMVVPLPSAAAAAQGGSRELLIIEDDDLSAATIVPGKQFRRLFSTLETAAGRSLMG